MKKREISAGAEKVENIARRGSLQGDAANNGASGAEQEREAAERRVQAALDKEREKKEKAERKERRREFSHIHSAPPHIPVYYIISRRINIDRKNMPSLMYKYHHGGQ